MIAYIDILSATSVTLKLYAVNSGTQTGTDKSAIAIGSSTIRKSVDLGALSDGDYDAESTSPPGRWALRVSGGVATFYDDWNQATLALLARLTASGATGTVGVVDNGNGTSTLTFKDTDGTTTVAIVTWNHATGARTRTS